MGKLDRSLKKYNQSKEDRQITISGTLGIPINGQKAVEVPGRAGFVFVKLKDNTSEVIQAYNSAVSNTYDLPVLVVRQNNIYRVIGRNLDLYRDWGNIPYLPKHGGQHSFNPALSMGADITWVYSQQIMPLLGYPSGTSGSPTISIAPHMIRDLSGNWKYVGNTGTQSLAPYNPNTGSRALMALVYLDTVSGNPMLLVNSGTYFSDSLTGSNEVAPYIPRLDNPNHLPITAIRLVSGTSTLTWNNVYDVRPFLRVVPTGSSGGGTNTFTVWDEGTPLGTATTLNVVGTPASISVSGSVARLFITGSAGTGGRDVLSSTRTIYVGYDLGAVSLSIASPCVVTKTAHGLENDDPVVLSIVPNRMTATISIANPAVVTATNHGYTAGQPIKFRTTGALPVVSPLTTYYVLATGLTANTFQFSTSVGGSAFDTSAGSQSGTHYIERVGALPTGLTEGTTYYVKNKAADTFQLSATVGGAAINTSGTQSGIPYLRTGNNNNNGTAATRTGAYLTIQKAIDSIQSIDLNIYNVIIQVADGKYTNKVSVSGVWLGAGTVTIQGNSTYLTNAHVMITSDHAFYLDNGATLNLQYLRIETISAGRCIWLAQNAYLTMRYLDFYGVNSDIHIFIGAYSTVSVTEDYTITEGAFGQHLYIDGGAYLSGGTVTVSLIYTPIFTDAYLYMRGSSSYFQAIGTTYDGAAGGGKRYNINYGATAISGGTLPGTLDGVLAYGGRYDSLPTTLEDGWISKSDTWTRTGNYTFTVSGNVTTTYRKGAKVRYKDGGAYEYGVIGSSSYSSPNTTVTLITNSDYAMAAATITDKYLSYIENPEGFPSYFNYTPTWSSDGTQPSLGDGTLTGVWSAIKNKLRADVALHTGSTSTYGTSTYRISLPVTSLVDVLGSSLILDISTVTYTEGVSQASATTTTMIFVVGSTIVQAASPFTFANGDWIWGSVEVYF